MTLDCILIPLFQQNTCHHDHTNDHDVLCLSEIERLVEGDIFLRRNRHRNIGLLPRKMRLSWLWLWQVRLRSKKRTSSPRLFYSSQFFAICHATMIAYQRSGAQMIIFTEKPRQNIVPNRGNRRARRKVEQIQYTQRNVRLANSRARVTYNITEV